MASVTLSQHKSLAGISDYQLGELIRKNIPERTYSNVHVMSEQHFFESAGASVTARKVSIHLSTFSYAGTYLKTLLGSTERFSYLPVNLCLIQDQLTGNCSQRGIEEVRKAYNASCSIILYFSEDLNYQEIETRM